jgi:hypothetical protein
MADKRPDGTVRGGLEPPDEVQDRPEQNATYDAVVRGTDSPPANLDEDFVPAPDNLETNTGVEDPDDRAARDAASAVRRRDHSAD